MQEELVLSTVIGLIYEASYKPSSWPAALEGIARYTHSSSAALICQYNELNYASDIYTYNISADTSAKHKAYGVDPNFRILSENVPLGKAAAIDHIIPDRKELENIYGDEFNKLLAEADMYYLGGAMLFMDDTCLAAIGLQHSKAMGPWTRTQLDRLDILVPHLQRTINIQTEFTRLQSSEQALHKGMDKLLMGLIFFDKKLRPVYINPVAESILKYHPAIHLQNNKIYTHTQALTKKLQAALVTAISSSYDSDCGESSKSLGLKHPDCASTLPVMISPVRGRVHGFDTDGVDAYAVMCFSDPEKSLPFEVDKLVDIYELTKVEAQVAISLANGYRPNEIAAIKNVAISTIRSQLKAIYRKLGVKSQAELVKVLLSGAFISSM